MTLFSIRESVSSQPLVTQYDSTTAKVKDLPFEGDKIVDACIQSFSSYVNNFNQGDNTIEGIYTTWCEEHGLMMRQENLHPNASTIKFLKFLINRIEPTLSPENSLKFKNFLRWEILSVYLQSIEILGMKKNDLIPFFNKYNCEIDSYLEIDQQNFDLRVRQTIDSILRINWKEKRKEELVNWEEALANLREKLHGDRKDQPRPLTNFEKLFEKRESIRNPIIGFIAYLRYQLALSRSEQEIKEIVSLPDEWFYNQLSNLNNDSEYFQSRTTQLRRFLQQQIKKLSKEIVAKSLANEYRVRSKPYMPLPRSSDSEETGKTTKEAAKTTNSEGLAGHDWMLINYITFTTEELDQNTNFVLKVQPCSKRFFIHTLSLYLEKYKKKNPQEISESEKNAFEEIFEKELKFIFDWQEEALFLNSCSEFIACFFERYKTKTLKLMEKCVIKQLDLRIKTLEIEMLKQRLTGLEEKCAGIKVTECLINRYMPALVERVRNHFHNQLEKAPPNLGGVINRFFTPEIFIFYLREMFSLFEERLRNIHQFEEDQAEAHSCPPLATAKSASANSSGDSLLSTGTSSTGTSPNDRRSSLDGADFVSEQIFPIRMTNDRD